MNTPQVELKQKARFAGILYFLIGVFSFYGVMYVSSQIQVMGDAQATFNNLLKMNFYSEPVFTHTS